MPKLSDIISFRRDLFFDGAVQIKWFETDPERRDKAAANFVFHGADYHGVSKEDSEHSDSFSLTDTVSFVNEIIHSLNPETENKIPFALSIAGWGTGKSHLGLALATLFSDTQSSVSEKILSNIEAADPSLGYQIRKQLGEWEYPALVIPINGMEDFSLSAELNRQIIRRLKDFNLDTAPVEELTPRFKIAETFVERNFDLRAQAFADRFGPEKTAADILFQLQAHDDLTYQHVNEIFEIANGYPIRSMGQESPQQLIQTVCENYCGDEGPFQSLLILFDEFGRYLEFAAERPHVAGDAALQQLLEGVQTNSERCFLLCFIQYELKAYLSRLSHESRITTNRYIGRYDSARKFYLSTNLETLFAHLIQKKDKTFLPDYLRFSETGQQWEELQQLIRRWFPRSEQHAVWKDPERFKKVIAEGCWPLHPAATWFLCRIADSGKELQQRSAISFIEESLAKQADREISETDIWTVSATRLCMGPLIEELISSEESGHRGAVAQAYIAAEQRYKDSFTDQERHSLLAVLVAAKTGLKVQNQAEACQALSVLSGLPLTSIQESVRELTKEHGVLEWNERFQRYEIIGDAVPRSNFTAFLRKKSSGISAEQAAEIFTAHMKNWAELEEITPEFSSINDIRSTEWRFQANCVHFGQLETAIKNAVQDWKAAIQTDSPRGQLIYCYVSPDSKIEEIRSLTAKKLDNTLAAENCDSGIPLLIVMLWDTEGKLKQALSEYWILNNELSEEDRQRYTNFIKDHSAQVSQELKLLYEKMVQERNYIYPKAFQLENARLRKISLDLFEKTYPKIVPFPFDGFSTSRGNAAKDCREITAELLNGTLNEDWISSRATRTQNRAVTLLKRSWQVLGDDGNITDWAPPDSKLFEIISVLEQSLKNEAELNLGAVFDTLIKPPYGCNIASAGLIIGVFLAPRKDCTALLFQGKETASSGWIGKAFSGNFLDRKILGQTAIRYVTEDETNEWRDLLNRWNAERTHAGRVQYMEQSDMLNERIKAPSGTLYERWMRLKGEAETSWEQLSAFEDALEKADTFYFRAYQKEDAANLSRTGKDLSLRLKKMRQEETQWTADQFEQIRSKIDQTKQAVRQFFDPWMSQQSILKPQQIGDFKHRTLEQVGGNLKELGLNDLFKQLDRHVMGIISNIEERQKLAYIVDEARAFLDSRRVSESSKIAELNDWAKHCDELNRTLRRVRDRNSVPDIERCIEDITKFKKYCKDQTKQHKKRAEKLWNRKFSNLEDVRAARSEIRELMDIFSGQEMDMEDISRMDGQSAQFERDFSLWNDLSIPNEELSSMVSRRIEEILALQPEDDPPPWDVEEIYETVLENLLIRRRENAKRWFESAVPRDEHIPDMNADICAQYLNRLENAPAYIEAEQSEQIKRIKIKLEERLDGLQVEGLLVRFRQLSESLQKQFLEIAGAELGPSKL